MLRYLITSLLLIPFITQAQREGDWINLRIYAHNIGVDTLCETPDTTCLKAYFTQIVYGKVDPRLGYRGVPERMDTVRLNRLTQQFLAGGDWCSLLDSIESHDRNYRQLKAYCIRCLIDDYMADSLTIEQTKSALNFYRWLNRFPADKRIIVNIPSATLRVIDQQGETLLTSRVIVGKASTPTPVFTAQLTNLITYPYWHIPRSITIHELLPKIRKNPAVVLADMNIQVIDARGRLVRPDAIDWTTSTATTFPYRLRQSTGCDNALGVLKFTLNSPYDIYLHDTNQRALFAGEHRTLSHGCIRVEKPVELANLLLGYKRFSPSYLTSCAKQARPQTIPLPTPVPVIITYNVVDMDETGAVQVYKDVYRFWQLAL